MRTDRRDNDEIAAGDIPQERGDDLLNIYAPPPAPDAVSRREFMKRVTLALAGIVSLAMASPVAAFLLAPLFRKPPEIWRQIGAVSDFTAGSTIQVTFLEASPLPWAGVTAKTAAWLRKVSDGEFICFTVSCSHLGCPVRWVANANIFLCPCHGGVYYQDGAVAAGPPPHGLGRYPTRVRNGMVEVNVSTKPAPLPGQHRPPS